MPIPTPKPNEAEGSFMSRCIRFVTNEGTPQEQAIAICSSQYRKEKLKVMTWKTIDRKRASYIKYAKTEFSRALKTQANEYLDQVKQSGLSAEYTISRAPIENAMFNVYSRVMTQFARDTFSDLSKRANKTEVNWDEWVARWFDDNVIDLTDLMTGTTERSVREIAQRAIIEGWGIREFQNNLFDLYQISERRAELIGRTEIIRASNAGSLMGAQETGFPMQKFWLATRDNRTRGLNPEDLFDHYSMDEDKGIPLDQAFNVSGEYLQHPGDRAGSPGNTINCRCTMTYQVLEEMPEEFEEEAEESIIESTESKGVSAKYTKNIPDDPMDITQKEIEDLFDYIADSDFSKAYLKEYDPNYRYRIFQGSDITDDPSQETLQGIISKFQGFDNKPKVLNESQIRELVKDGNHIPFYRGVQDYDDISADAILDQLRYGKFFHGNGHYGDGTYSAGRKAINVAKEYAGENQDNIITGLFNQNDMRVADFFKLNAMQLKISNEYLDDNGYLTRKLIKKYKLKKNDQGSIIWTKKARAERDAFYDLLTNKGAFATALGYDAIYVNKLDFWVFLNRSKMTLQDKNGITRFAEDLFSADRFTKLDN
jgi:hypothetical protein